MRVNNSPPVLRDFLPPGLPAPGRTARGRREHAAGGAAMGELMTIRAAARAAGVDDRTVRRWIATGRITATITPAGKRVDPAELLRIGVLLNVPVGAARVVDTPGHDVEALRRENILLRGQLEDAMRERDKWSAMAERLALAPPQEPRRPWWAWWRRSPGRT